MPSLDNAMIFGGIANLRLAPHVREGRPLSSVRAVRPTEETSASEASAAATSPSRARGFVAAEKVSISTTAQQVLDTQAPIDPSMAVAGPVDGTTGERALESVAGGVAAPPARGIVPSNVATAYSAASGAAASSARSVVTASSNGRFA